MKIAFLIGDFPLLSETFVMNRITGLLKRGHDVTVYAHANPNEPFTHQDVVDWNLLDRMCWYHSPFVDDYLDRGRLRLALCPQLALEAVKHVPLFWKSLSMASRGLTSKRRLKLFLQALRFLPPATYDVIHCVYGPYGILGMRLRDLDLLKGKLVVSFHGFDLGPYLVSEGLNVYAELFQKADLILPTCAYQDERLKSLGCDSDKIAVHASGIDCPRFPFSFRSITSDEPVRLLSTGRLVEKKGFEYGLEAVSRLVAQGRRVRYTIAGEGPLRESLQALSSRFCLDGIVHFTGPVNQRTLVTLLEESRILLCPSVTTEVMDEEGSPNVMKEAMASGLSVVATNHGGIPEVIEDGVTGFLVPQRDADALAEKVALLIDDPELRLHIAKAARNAVVEKFDLDTLSARLEKLYRSVLS